MSIGIHTCFDSFGSFITMDMALYWRPGMLYINKSFACNNSAGASFLCAKIQASVRSPNDASQRLSSGESATDRIVSWPTATFVQLLGCCVFHQNLWPRCQPIDKSWQYATPWWIKSTMDLLASTPYSIGQLKTVWPHLSPPMTQRLPWRLFDEQQATGWDCNYWLHLSLICPVFILHSHHPYCSGELGRGLVFH